VLVINKGAGGAGGLGIVMGNPLDTKKSQKSTSVTISNING
jgi:hypothetical protein